MKRLPRWVLTVMSVFGAFVATWGCGPKDTGPAVSTPPEGWQQQAGRMGGGPGGPGGRGGPGGGRGGSPIGQLMGKLDKGPNSLRNISNNLNGDAPDWSKIQAQTTDYAQNAGELGKLDPSKGSKETWAKLTAAFATSATELDKAAQAKDAATAKNVVTKIQGSCKECHDGHRGGPGGGFGPPGGRGGPGGGRPGGPPGGGS